MSDEVHPLFSVLAGWANNAPRPLVSFDRPERFQNSIDRAAKLDHRVGYEHAKNQQWITYNGAAVLGKILVGSRFNIELHSMIYHAAAGSPLAFALCDAALDACKFGAMARTSFYVAANLDGFLNALEAWTRHFEYNVEYFGPDRLPFILREIVEKNAPGNKFWLAACQDDYTNAISFTKSLSGEYIKLEDANRK